MRKVCRTCGGKSGAIVHEPQCVELRERGYDVDCSCEPKVCGTCGGTGRRPRTPKSDPNTGDPKDPKDPRDPTTAR
jgi:hypothetical protein